MHETRPPEVQWWRGEDLNLRPSGYETYALVQLDFADSSSSSDLALYLGKWADTTPTRKRSCDIKI